MPGPSQYSLSRRALLAGGAAVLAGCSAGDPHDGDPDVESVTPAPVPMTGPERLAAIEQSDLPSLDPPSLVTDEHLDGRLDDVEALARDVDALLDETPTAAALAGHGDGTAGTDTTTTRQDDHRTNERLKQIEYVRGQARDTVRRARQFLEEERDHDDQAPPRPAYSSGNDAYLSRANNRLERLSVSLWMLRIAYGRVTLAELPDPTDIEPRLRAARSAIAYRCDGSGLGITYLSEVEQALRAALQSVADFEERTERRTGPSEEGGDTDATESTTTAREQATELPTRRVHETVSTHARAHMRLLDARQYLVSYENRIGDTRRCGDRLRATTDELRQRVRERRGWLESRLTSREDVEEYDEDEDSGDRRDSERLVRAVRNRFAVPTRYHEHRLERVDEFVQDGWVALPCRDLTRLLLWYRATATAVERLPDGPVERTERLDLVTSSHESAVERYTAAVDESRDDPLARRYLRHAASALGRAEELLTSLEPDAVDTRDGHRRLVQAYTLLLQVDGLSENAVPLSRIVRDA